MSPQLAVLACTLFILLLFWADRKRDEEYSGALWIPLVWMFIAGSRSVSEWLNFNSFGNLSLAAYADTIRAGSPADRYLLLLLTVVGVVVLSRRRVSWSQLLVRNRWIWLFFLFGAVSISWSIYPFVAFKRLVRTLGSVVMVLVILTEKRPYEAIGVLLRRLAYLLVPLSILLIEYFPTLGTKYSWSDGTMYIGVATQKNELGRLCLIAGIAVCWTLLYKRGGRSSSGATLNTSLCVLLFGMIAWLLYLAHSATSLVCLVLALGILVIGRLPFLAQKPGRMMAVGIAAICFLGSLQLTLGLSNSALALLGRNPTLTGRVGMWKYLVKVAANPLVGAGYGSFWLGPRLLHAWQYFGHAFTQAHNGYLQTYLDLGLVGVSLIVGSIASGLLKVRRHLISDFPAAMLKLCLIVTVSIYTTTEAVLEGSENMWILLLLGILAISGQEKWGQREIEAGSEETENHALLPVRRSALSPHPVEQKEMQSVVPRVVTRSKHSPVCRRDR